jgi:hypothetical protein
MILDKKVKKLKNNRIVDIKHISDSFKSFVENSFQIGFIKKNFKKSTEIEKNNK